MTVTVDQFLERLKARVTLPANNELLSTTSLLTIGDDVVRDKMVSLMMSVNQNYFVTTETETLVDGQDAYSIPYRAIGRTLRDLKLVSTGDERASDMSLVALEDEHMFVAGGGGGTPSFFYFEGDQIKLRPVPNTTSYYLKKFYDLQPGCMVTSSSAACVASVAGNVVTISGAMPSVITAGVDVDFIQGRQGCRTLGMDETVTNVSATDITFASADDIPASLAAGDFVSLAQTSPVVQFPDEALPLIVTLAAVRVMHAVGDFEAQSKLEEDAARQETSLLKLITPRIQGENTKIVNRRGLLRGQGFNFWRSRYGSYP